VNAELCNPVNPDLLLESAELANAELPNRELESLEPPNAEFPRWEFSICDSAALGDTADLTALPLFAQIE
jgi:hypothetical protein